jgi:hypothetical protein
VVHLSPMTSTSVPDLASPRPLRDVVHRTGVQHVYTKSCLAVMVAALAVPAALAGAFALLALKRRTVDKLKDIPSCSGQVPLLGKISMIKVRILRSPGHGLGTVCCAWKRFVLGAPW